MTFSIFRRRNTKKRPSPLELPAAEQKKLYKQAADDSAETQRVILKEYEQTFGEKIEKNR